MSRYALIIATSAQEDPGLASLRSPAVDRAALEEVLGDPEIGGYAVESVSDARYHEVGERIGDFLKQRGPDDTVLLYFTCHGVRSDDGELYFACVNTRMSALEDTAIPASRLARQMERSRCKRIILVLDCCFSGAIAHSVRAFKGPMSVSDSIRTALTGQGRVIITASTATEYAFADGERDDGFSAPIGSAFTSALVEGLRDGSADLDRNGEISCEELFHYLERRLIPRQTPTFNALDLRGEVLFARNPNAAERGVPMAATHIFALLPSLYDSISVAWAQEDSPTWERTHSLGVPLVDAMLGGGLRAGELTALASSDLAESAVLLRSCASTAATAAAPVFYLDLQDLPRTVLGSFVAAEARVPLNRVLNAVLNEDEWTRTARAMGRMDDRPLHLANVNTTDLADIVAAARGKAELDKTGLDLLVVCGADLIETRDGRPVSAGGVAAGLADLAAQMNIAVLASFFHRPEDATRLYTAVGRRAGVVLALQRLADAPDDEGSYARLRIAQNPRGGLWEVGVVVNPALQTIREMRQEEYGQFGWDKVWETQTAELEAEEAAADTVDQPDLPRVVLSDFADPLADDEDAPPPAPPGDPQPSLAELRALVEAVGDLVGDSPLPFSSQLSGRIHDLLGHAWISRDEAGAWRQRLLDYLEIRER